MPPVDNIRGHVTFAILTMRDDEFTAVLKRFPDEERSVAVCRVLEQGQGPAQSATHDAIVDLDPQWVVLAGIAGAVPSEDFTLGDVLLASRIHDFSVSAALDGGRTTYQQTGGPDLTSAVLAQAMAAGAKFSGCDLADVDFAGANLNYAQFNGTKNLTAEKLRRAKTLYLAQGLPDDVRAE